MKNVLPVGVSDAVRRIFEVSGVIDLLTVLPTRDAASAALVPVECS